jgi:hypothetical protein
VAPVVIMDLRSPQGGADEAKSAGAPASRGGPSPLLVGRVRSRGRRLGAGEPAIREPGELDAQAGRHVADGVEGAIVGDDLDAVAGTGVAQPNSGGGTDAQVTPILDSGGLRAVNELRAVPREESSALVADHSPIADGEKLGARLAVVDGEVFEHTGDVLGATAVLDVEKNRPMRSGPIGPMRGSVRSAHPSVNSVALSPAGPKSISSTSLAVTRRGGPPRMSDQCRVTRSFTPATAKATAKRRRNVLSANPRRPASDPNTAPRAAAMAHGTIVVGRGPRTTM